MMMMMTKWMKTSKANWSYTTQINIDQTQKEILANSRTLLDTQIRRKMSDWTQVTNPSNPRTYLCIHRHYMIFEIKWNTRSKAC